MAEILDSFPESKTASPEYFLEWRLVNRYGITLEEYHELLGRQGGGCAICGATSYIPDKPSWGLAVDHCHDSKQVRGLLCMKCNRAVGLLDDDSNLALRLYDYLSQ